MSSLRGRSRIANQNITRLRLDAKNSPSESKDRHEDLHGNRECPLGEHHSFMHHLESFFRVLFWICIHYDTGKDVGETRFDRWHSIVVIADDGHFLDIGKRDSLRHTNH